MIPTIPGVEVLVVESGTVICDYASGRELTVTDEKAVFNGSRCFVTQVIYEALEERFK